MEDLIFKADEFISLVIIVLTALQAIVVYVLPPEKAVRFNVIGKVLDFLTKTKAGLSGSIK